MRNARKGAGVKITYPKNFTPVLTEQAAAAEFSAVIIPFSTGQLAQATGRSKDTVKCWKAGRTFPNGVSLMALIEDFPQIDAWVRSKTGRFNSPHTVTDIFSEMEKLLTSDSASGRAARARFQQIMAERK